MVWAWISLILHEAKNRNLPLLSRYLDIIHLSIDTVRTFTGDILCSDILVKVRLGQNGSLFGLTPRSANCTVIRLF
jgi:hypothetical protein